MNIKRDGCCRREEFAWDDSEERRYRAWVTEEARGREQAEWAEYSQEEETRRRARREVEDRAKDTVVGALFTNLPLLFISSTVHSIVEVEWEDGCEAACRAEYRRLRQAEGGAVAWDTSGEREAQLRAREQTEQRRGHTLAWEDGAERACMEETRRKYNK